MAKTAKGGNAGKESIMPGTAENEKVQESVAYAAEEKAVEGAEDRAPTERAGERAKGWLVRVRNNPGFCGIGAGGVQFANGQAVVSSGRMAQWFMEHKGYEVTEV